MAWRHFHFYPSKAALKKSVCVYIIVRIYFEANKMSHLE
jgi:hypothetical protein